MPQQITTEPVALSEATSGASIETGRFPIQVITPGKGSSGWYSASVCESAAALVQPGTPMYLDHPTESDEFERPERSLRDLVAVFTEAGTWDPDAQRVVAEAQVFAPYREVIAEMAPYIGVSIRGDGNIVEGALPTGGRGRVVESITAIQSVDFVTKAGRGGKVLALLESARGTANKRAVARGIAEATANDIREQLDNELTDTYGGEKTWTSVRDFDDTTVWFYLETPDEQGTFQQAYSTTDGAIALTGDRTEVRVVTTYVPVSPAGSTQESKEDTMPNIEESELARLREADGRVRTLEAERDAAVQRAEVAESERDAATTANRVTEARTAAVTRARTRVTEANATLASTVVDRIVAEATREVPMTDAGVLDEAALDAQVDAARTAEETYLAGLAEAAGAGRVIGLGQTGPVAEGEVTRETNRSAIAEAFGRRQTATKEA